MSSRSWEHLYTHPKEPGWRHREHRMSMEYILTMVMCVHIISRDLLAVCAGLLFVAGVSGLIRGSFGGILWDSFDHS